MNLPCLVVFATLGASPSPDAGVQRDAGPPAWVPRNQRVDLTEAAYYGLRREGDGYVYESAQFEAHVARDGVVSFKDKHGSLNLWPLPSSFKSAPLPKGPTLESTLRDYFGKRRKPTPPPAPPPGPPPHRIDWNDLCPPGSDCDVRGKPMMISVQGNFDLTDEIMRAYGQDPYAREKARFLSSTFELRIRMAIAARKTDMKSALEHLPERLDELWGDQRYTARERRRVLYELWYETDRTPEGERAARTIDAFIRRRLPCGSPDGYTGGELELFDQLHPERRFPVAADCEPAPK
jgi:hypothetical protein